MIKINGYIVDNKTNEKYENLKKVNEKLYYSTEILRKVGETPKDSP